jgi:cytochrome c-type biogenesis protein
MAGTDLTILVAVAAGVISFLSPCVLPLVPAYVGQLTAIAVASAADGSLRIPALARPGRPPDAGAAGSLATATGSVALGRPNASGAGPRLRDRVGGRVVSARGGWLASFGLGAIFAVGWSPCIGIILGGILTLAATSETAAQGAILLAGYTIGLGLPFLAIAALYDRAPGLLRPLVRHGRLVSLAGGLLVVAIGVAMILDWLSLLPRVFNFAGV